MKAIRDEPRQDPIDGFISHLSHDLKAPVRAIAQLVNWIEEESREADVANSETVDQYFQLLKNRSARLQNLITDLTTYARVGIDDDPFDGNWDMMIRRIKGRVPTLEDFYLKCQLNATPQITQSDLENLLCALLSNASKHHHLGQGRICVTVSAQATGCCLSVADDGPGIPADKITRATEMLVTLQGQDKVEGSGMGLSIAQRIANHYDGALTIHNRDEAGCRVAVTLPTQAKCPA